MEPLWLTMATLPLCISKSSNLCHLEPTTIPERDPGGRLQIIFCRKVEGREIRKPLKVDGQNALVAHRTLGVTDGAVASSKQS